LLADALDSSNSRETYLVVKKAFLAPLSLVAVLFLSSLAFAQASVASKAPRPAVGQAPVKTKRPVSIDVIKGDLAEALSVIEKNHVDGASLDYNEVFKGSMDAMLHTLDPHSNYFDAKETEQFRTDQLSEYFGIGATIGDMSDPQGKVIATFIKATFDGAPAQKAGLRYGDKIVDVNGQSMLGRPFSEVRNFLRGPAGTIAKITVERAATGQRETVQVARAAVPQPSISEAYMIRPGVGYLSMRGGFTRKTYDEFYKDMRDLKAQGMQQLVIDLRDNGGGLVFQAYRVASTFLSAGQRVFTQKGRYQGVTQPYESENPNPDRSPIVILVNRNTASASEILAGALQDHDRALIAGTNTFGKGLVQNPFEDIGGGSMLLLTIAKYETPSGRLIQRDYSNGDLYAYLFDGGSLRDDDAAPSEPQGVASKTDIGRSVYSGGGITPDVRLKPQTITLARDRVQRKLVSPVFAFALDLSLGRVKGFENYKVDGPITFDYDIKPTDFPVTPALYQAFKRFAVDKYKAQPAQLDAEREFIERTLRSELVTAAYGSQTSFQVFNQYDTQLQKAIDLLPQARQLALQSERARNLSKKSPAN
jgi:carboxyl-terminal processing protease